MATVKKGGKQFNFRIDEDLAQEFEKTSELLGHQRSELLILWIKEYIETHRQEVKEIEAREKAKAEDIPTIKQQLDLLLQKISELEAEKKRPMA